VIVRPNLFQQNVPETTIPSAQKTKGVIPGMVFTPRPRS
jgi:hypothetical protein